MARTRLFSGFGKTFFWKKATALEFARFGFYLSVPVMASLIYANPEAMRYLILHMNFVEYPKAGPVPTIKEDLEKAMRLRKEGPNKH